MPTINYGNELGVRPLSLPPMISAPPPDPIQFFEDFYTANVGPALGTVTQGHPEWQATLLDGDGTAPSAVGRGGTGPGVLTITTGAVAGDGYVVDLGKISTTGAGSLNLASESTKWNSVFIVQTGLAVTNLNWGVGLVASGLTLGSNWITDPNTTLDPNSTGNQSSIVITRHAAAYAGNEAGSLWVRYYSDNGNAVDSTAQRILPSCLPSTNYRFELAYALTPIVNSASVIPTFTLYTFLNGVLTATNSWTSPNMLMPVSRPSFIATQTSSAARSIHWDLYYQEVQFSTTAASTR